MKVIDVVAWLYLTFGVAFWIRNKGWLHAIWGVREGAQIDDKSVTTHPTPRGAMLVAIAVGFMMDVLLWPYNEWAIRQEEEEP